MWRIAEWKASQYDEKTVWDTGTWLYPLGIDWIVWLLSFIIGMIWYEWQVTGAERLLSCPCAGEHVFREEKGAG